MEKYPGTCYVKRLNKWAAYIPIKGKQIWLGTFKEQDDATNARKQAEKEYKITPNSKKKIENITILKKCFCGNEFKATTNQKYCSKECARIAKNKRQSEWKNSNPEKYNESQAKYDYESQNRKYYLKHRDEIISLNSKKLVYSLKTYNYGSENKAKNDIPKMQQKGWTVKEEHQNNGVYVVTYQKNEKV